jgi:hypothetical protein
MYCPSCGAQNVDSDARFCRGCGKDLRLVSQALTKRLSWWRYIAAKIDDRFEAEHRKEELSRGLVYIYHAIPLLFIGTLLLIFNHDFLEGWIILIALSLLGFGIRDYWVYRRSLSHEYHPDPTEVKKHLGDLTIYKPGLGDGEPAGAASSRPTEELTPHKLPPTPPQSVTEQTTRLLDESHEHSKRSS